ncbi:Protein of uncharacterised function (DUF2509) [Salmonella enterica subsp. enterica serovar Daytona]|uniref:Protein of uncharacterized function (DUF2509) n=1 Tax=Salmonella enterica subsp. enterica serovar Daytona TaxID=1962639 RepID=A0A447JD17_SALET|nr:Protein of uncharacterised function (DUF2509) [Salmonella enterica subsp. enterica serovar Daytona]
MNRERGASSLILALLILILGSLLLQGVNQQQASYAARVTTQSLAIQRQALVQSALEMGAGAAMVRRNRNGMSALFPFRSEGLFAEIIGG